MTHMVYGFRLIGAQEMRYIGQTQFDGEHRLAYELQLAKMRSRWGVTDASAEWLIGNQGNMEAITLLRCASVEEARRCERDVIRACLAMGHRLLNRQHVPAALRISAAGIARPASEGVAA